VKGVRLVVLDGDGMREGRDEQERERDGAVGLSRREKWTQKGQGAGLN
jgi:hypothetical protein